jgi:hypothetical protein
VISRRGRVATPTVNDRWRQNVLGSIASRWLDSLPFAVQVLIHPTEHATRLSELKPLGQQVSVSVQEVAPAGGRGRQASSWLLKLVRLLPDGPHAGAPAARGNFSGHPSRFLVYSRCTSPRDMPPR